MSFESTQMKIIRWSEARRIIPNSTPQAQLLKAFEEMGELAAAEARGNVNGIKDSLGDVLVCLVNYCALRDLDLVKCMEYAYDEIKDRTGMMMPNGVFVKD